MHTVLVWHCLILFPSSSLTGDCKGLCSKQACAMNILYLFNLQAVPSLIFWEVRRKDFWENMAHHIATLGLITYSYHVK